VGDVYNRGTKDRPVWYCRYKDADGRRKNRPTHMPTKAGAMRFLAQIEERIAGGKVGIPDKTDEERRRQTITMRELAQRFLEDYANPVVKDLDEYRRQAQSLLRKHILPALGEVPVMSIRRRDVEGLRDRILRAGRSKQTAIHVLNLISRLLKWAVGQELIDPVNPCAGVERPSLAHTESVDFLDASEVGRLLAHAEEDGPPLGNSPRTTLDELALIQSTDVILPTTESPSRELRLRCVVQPDAAQRVLLNQLGLRPPERLRLPASASLPV
jgi:hypothetical protein